jgi:hypothetical protein
MLRTSSPIPTEPAASSSAVPASTPVASAQTPASSAQSATPATASGSRRVAPATAAVKMNSDAHSVRSPTVRAVAIASSSPRDARPCASGKGRVELRISRT